MRRRALGRVVAALAAGGGLAAGALVLTAPDAGAANYGSGALYQVEISANTSPTTFGATQGNFWIWAALHPSSPTITTHGTADYQETDCIHLDALGFPVQAAAHDTGEGSWHIATTTLYLTTVKIIGGLETATIAVPLPTKGTYGHTEGVTLTVTKGTTPTGHTPLPLTTPLTYPSENQIAR